MNDTYYVIDIADAGQAGFSYIVTGLEINQSLDPPRIQTFRVDNFDQMLAQLSMAWNVNVLVIGDHGLENSDHTPAGIQECGTNQLDPKNPHELNQLANILGL